MNLFNFLLIGLFLICFIDCSPNMNSETTPPVLTYQDREFNFRAKSQSIGNFKINTSLNEIYREDGSVIRYLSERVVNNCTEFYDMNNRHFMTTCIDTGEVPGSKQYVTYFQIYTN